RTAFATLQDPPPSTSAILNIVQELVHHARWHRQCVRRASCRLQFSKSAPVRICGCPNLDRLARWRRFSPFSLAAFQAVCLLGAQRNEDRSGESDAAAIA